MDALEGFLREIDALAERARALLAARGIADAPRGNLHRWMEQMRAAVKRSEPPPAPAPETIPAELLEASCLGKRAYRTVQAAGRAADFAHSNGSTDALRIYSCLLCGGFHLTHKTLSNILVDCPPAPR